MSVVERVERRIAAHAPDEWSPVANERRDDDKKLLDVAKACECHIAYNTPQTYEMLLTALEAVMRGEG